MKNIFFIWEGGPMSFLRVMTLISFRNHHKDWNINLLVSNRKDFIWRATHDGLVAQDFSNTNRDDCFSLCHDANINVINLDQEYGSIFSEGLANISPVHKKDMLNWHILGDNTGIVADMDILFIRSLDAEYAEFLESGAEFGITCFSGLPKKNYLPVSIMFGKNSEFCNEVFLKSKEEYNPDVYESCGANLFPPTLHEEVLSPECVKFYRISDELIFPLTTKMNFEQALQVQYYSDNPNIINTDNTAGIHWYGGNPLSQQFNNKTDHENYIHDTSIMAHFIKENFSRY